MEYEYVLQLAYQLTPEDRRRLVDALQSERERILAEFKRRREAGENATDSLYFGKYANPAVDLSYEELEATIHEAANEWEDEIDEYASSDD